MPTEEKLDIGPATLFNAHQTDLGARLNTFTNYLLVVDGGILSITIGAFVGVRPPSLAPEGLLALRNGWILLTVSLILALSAAFFVLVAQALVQAQWRRHFSAGEPRQLKLMTGPNWFRVVIWAALAIAFLSCITGIACVSYGASEMLRLPTQ